MPDFCDPLEIAPLPEVSVSLNPGTLPESADVSDGDCECQPSCCSDKLEPPYPDFSIPNLPPPSGYEKCCLYFLSASYAEIALCYEIGHIFLQPSQIGSVGSFCQGFTNVDAVDMPSNPANLAKFRSVTMPCNPNMGFVNGFFAYVEYQGSQKVTRIWRSFDNSPISYNDFKNGNGYFGHFCDASGGMAFNNSWIYISAPCSWGPPAAAYKFFDFSNCPNTRGGISSGGIGQFNPTSAPNIINPELPDVSDIVLIQSAVGTSSTWKSYGTKVDFFDYDQHNYNPGNASLLLLATDDTGPKNLTGLSMSQVDGQRIIIKNIGSFDNLILPYESSLSAAQNRLVNPPAAGSDVIVPGQTVSYRYTTSLNRWLKEW